MKSPTMTDHTGFGLKPVGRDFIDALIECGWDATRALRLVLDAYRDHTSIQEAKAYLARVVENEGKRWQ